MGFGNVIERFTEGDRLTIVILCNRTEVDPEKPGPLVFLPKLSAKRAVASLNAANLLLSTN